MSTHPSRRRLLQITGGSGIALLAGCPDDNDDDDVNDDDVNDDVEEDWEDVEEFYFEGVIEEWTGIEPEFIEGESNPTITLIEGQEYDFRWVNGDGVTHNLEIRDEDDEIIEDYQSEDVGEEGEETILEGVVATEEMDVYICTYHEGTQVGDIEIETE
ncbi:PKD domain-containing protein [Natronococcus pandeyae]|uniref:PKD domain-containing protein n=1 Tax=Natronococcus pandeyae TaxID=2055836 RepID=A0A8J8TPF8_9EURY|nr:PKD domain-containing protein [Natronococcus pandeyae]TYL37388.1 PKD domain-containing protein [Natronococcus pandeyae]